MPYPNDERIKVDADTGEVVEFAGCPGCRPNWVCGDYPDSSAPADEQLLAHFVSD